MTITRETLELAAKAAGIDIDRIKWRTWRLHISSFDNNNPLCHPIHKRTWSPHICTADAVGLARKLHLLIDFQNADSGYVFDAAQQIYAYWPKDCDNWMEAVTLCAAEVQRAKEGGK